MKEIWRRRREKIEKKGVGDRKKNVNFWNCIFMFVIRNLKARRANKASSMSCTFTTLCSFYSDFY
jgi:hypothetical protein